jgi:lysophospholipase L1-like esterase
VALVLSLALLGSAVAGYLLGSAQAQRARRADVRKFTGSETLAGAIRAVGLPLEEFALAYEDPAATLAMMDRMAWSVPNSPTPFVGTAPLEGRWANATINAQQFRRATLVLVPKPAGTVRVFVTGGSTAFGVGATGDAETIPGFLEEQLQRELAPRTGLAYEVVNAANYAWVSTHERILIENRLSEMEPDLVVSLTGLNDVNFGFGGASALWMRTYAEGHFLRLVEMVYKEAVGRSFPRLGRTVGPISPAEIVRVLTKNARLSALALKPTGAPYLVCLQPALSVTRKGLTARERRHLEREIQGKGVNEYFRRCFAVYREELPRLEEEGIHYADLSVVFDDADADAEIFLDAYHFGDRGNRLLARRLFEVVAPLLAARAAGR